MDKQFKEGDIVHHRNLGLDGKFIGYAWESGDECDVEFTMEDGYVEQRHVSVNQLELIHSGINSMLDALRESAGVKPQIIKESFELDGVPQRYNSAEGK